MGSISVNITLRPGRPDDAENCGRICYEAFTKIADQHNFPHDFPDTTAAVGLLSFLLSRGDIYSVVAEIDGRIAGSNYLWENAVIAGVGPITVDPALQNSDVGKQLMVDVMRRAQEKGFAGVRLVQAAYHNRSLALYTKLGFDTREPLSTIQGQPPHVELAGYPVRLATQNDLEACNNLAVKVHGFSRGTDVHEAINQGTATVVERNGRITGYATVVGFFGHAVCESNDDLKALIGAAQAFVGPGFLLPTRNGEVMRWCLANGLRVIQPLTLMSTGLYNEPDGAFLPSIVY
jgi:predicted N-acetyltransferase YhbS